MFYENLVPYRAKFIKAFNKVMDAQHAAVLAKVKGSKALTTKQVSPFNVAEASDAVVAAVTPAVLAAAEAQGQFAGQLIGYDTPAGMTPRVRNYIQNRLDTMAHEFSRDTSDAVAETLNQGLSGTLSIDEIGNQIDSLYEGITSWQADRIARTELAAASHESQVEAWQGSSVVTGEQWQADPEACEFCQELDGTIISLEDDGFAAVGDTLIGAEGGMLNVDYTDIAPGTAHPNCECASVPYIGDDVTPDMGPNVVSPS